MYGYRPINGQALVSNTNNTKQENITKQPKDSQSLISFFKEKGFDAMKQKNSMSIIHSENGKQVMEVRFVTGVACNYLDG